MSQKNRAMSQKFAKSSLKKVENMYKNMIYFIQKIARSVLYSRMFTATFFKILNKTRHISYFTKEVTYLGRKDIAFGLWSAGGGGGTKGMKEPSF
jgi:hypothetical protein